MEHITSSFATFFSIVVVAIVIIILAMGIDLISGINKAKQRKEMRSSYGLKRTLSKFIQYIGGLLIATGVDVLIQLCNIFVLLGLDVMYNIPIITCLVAIFLLAVEFKSVREKADEKTRNDMNDVARTISKCVTKDDLLDAIRDVVTLNNDRRDSIKKEDTQEY